MNRKKIERIWKEMVLICTRHTPKEAENPAHTHKKLLMLSRMKPST
jgi:hypothetical protein